MKLFSVTIVDKRQPGSSRVKEDRPFMVVPITRCFPIARARWRAPLNSCIADPVSLCVCHEFTVCTWGKEEEKEMNQRPTNLMNRARSLSPPADDRSGALHSILNFLSYATVTKLMIFPRGIYATLMAKDSNCAQNKLKFHTAKKLWKLNWETIKSPKVSHSTSI